MSLEEVLASVLSEGEPRNTRQIIVAMLLGLAPESWQLPIIDYLHSTVSSALQRDPSFVEDPKDSGRWRLKLAYTRRRRLLR